VVHERCTTDLRSNGCTLRKTITKRAVDALKPGQIIADDRLPGFVVRCLPSGRLAYGYRFTKTDRRRWLAIGVGIPPEAARKAAVAHAGAVAKDQDPMTAREQRRRRALTSRTLDEVLDAYLKERVTGRLRTEREIASLFERHVRPVLGWRPVNEIRRLHIVELLDDIAADTSPRAADKTLGVLRTALNWHASRDDEFRSPIVSGMARTSLKELSRDRILTDEEIRSVWAACNQVTPAAYAQIVRALLLSACRLNEVAGLSWREVEVDKIIIPADRVKTKTEHVVPLTPELAAQLGERGTGFVFSADGGSPFSGFSKAKKRLDGIIAAQRKRDWLEPMSAWRLHDLRRTARSLMSRAGVSSDIAERVLGHVMPGVRGVYDRHAYAAEKHEALERLAALLTTVLNPPTDNVVRLRPAS
jgi:integrase